MTEIEKCIEEYVQGTEKCIRKLSLKYKVCRKRISKVLKERGLTVENNYHKIVLNNYFTLSPCFEEEAYWLGFLYADGSITDGYNENTKEFKYALEVDLKESDVEHIEKLKRFLGSKRKISFRTKTKSCRIIINSKKLIENLLKIGFVKNKTYNYCFDKIFNNIPKEYKKDFIRGFFDGDGYFENKRKVLGFTSYFENVHKTLHKYLLEEIEIGDYRIHFKNNTCTSSTRYNRKDSKTIANFLYKNSNIHLDRKYKIYIENFAVS